MAFWMNHALVLHGTECFVDDLRSRDYTTSVTRILLYRIVAFVASPTVFVFRRRIKKEQVSSRLVRR